MTRIFKNAVLFFKNIIINFKKIIFFFHYENVIIIFKKQKQLWEKISISCKNIFLKILFFPPYKNTIILFKKIMFTNKNILTTYVSYIYGVIFYFFSKSVYDIFKKLFNVVKYTCKTINSFFDKLFNILLDTILVLILIYVISQILGFFFMYVFIFMVFYWKPRVYFFKIVDRLFISLKEENKSPTELEHIFKINRRINFLLNFFWNWPVAIVITTWSFWCYSGGFFTRLFLYIITGQYFSYKPDFHVVSSFYIIRKYMNKCIDFFKKNVTKILLHISYNFYMKRREIWTTVKYYICFLLKFLTYWFLYQIIYINIIYRIILYLFPVHFFLWGLDNKFGYFMCFLYLLDINNILLFFCTLFSTDLYIFNLEFDLRSLFSTNFFNVSWSIIKLNFNLCTYWYILGYKWLDLYFANNFGLTSVMVPCIFNFLIICDIFLTKCFSFVDFSTIFIFDLVSVPYFFYFFFFLFSTVILSWFFFSYLGIYGIFISNLISLFLFWISLLSYISCIFIENKIYKVKIFNWIFLNTNTKVDCFFLIDSISFSFILLTTTISLFVFIYAFSYFRYEPLVDRFLLFLLSFIISMIFLVSSGNLIMLFLGWELIGLTSFFLINFWTTKTATLKSSFKAFSFNKLSDFFLFIFIICIYNTYNTLNITTFLSEIYKNKLVIIPIFGNQIDSLEFLSICLLLASFIKSAQIGGHIWLPDSMEAPVPASALIHSATLVSAGIYLILRFNSIFSCTQFSHLLLPIIGSLTAAYGGICAASQTDLKKILAYSTISHCGFLVLLCSLEMNEFVIVYLYVHGFFKAIIFMCIGNILRISQNYQDYRRMGNLFKYLPFEYYCVLISLTNLAGLPFTFGFFTKHLIFLSLENHIYIYYFVLVNTFIGAVSGLFYSSKLLKCIFFGFKKGNKSMYLNLNSLSFNSVYYSNSSLASTVAISFLFLSSYIIIYYLFSCLIKNNFLFSDYFNLTLLSSYYFILNSFNGFNLNFVYINILVILSFFFLFSVRYSKTLRIHLLYKYIFFSCYYLLIFYLFYFILFPFLFNFLGLF